MKIAITIVFILFALWIILRFICRKSWVVRKCGFPLKEGYGVYNRDTRTILDTGLTREEAQKICDDLNKEECEK